MVTISKRDIAVAKEIEDEQQCTKSGQKPREVKNSMKSSKSKKRTNEWQMPEMGKTPKLSQLQKEIHNEDNQVEKMQLQPKREEEDEKEIILENEKEEQSIPDTREAAPIQGTVQWKRPEPQCEKGRSLTGLVKI